MARDVQLLDPYGRPVDTSFLKGEQAAPTLAGIRNIYSRLFPTSGLTPQKLTAIMRQADFGDPYLYLEMCEEIEEKDPHYAGVLNKRKNSVCELEMIVEPATKDKRDQAMAEFVRRVLFDESGFNLAEHTYDIQDAIGKGFSVTEIIWDTESRFNGRTWWIPTALKWRDQKWFMFDWIAGEQVLVRSLRTEGEEISKAILDRQKITGGSHLGGNWIWNNQGGQMGIQPLTAPLAPYKFITHFAKAKSGLPIRAGLTRCIAWTYLFKNIATKDWAQFLEKYGQPIRVGQYPAGATDEDKLILLAAVSGISTDQAGIIPADMKIDFQEMANAAGSSDMYERYLHYLDDLESKLVLGSTLGTEMHGNAGSRAAAGEHRDVERTLMQSDAKRLAATLNRDLLRPLIDLNLGPPLSGQYPKIKIGMPDDDDASKWTDVIVKLASAGMRIGQSTVREKLHIPEPEEGEELLTPPINGGALAGSNGAGGELQKGGRRKPGQSPQPSPDEEDTEQQASRYRGLDQGSVGEVSDDFAQRLQSHWKPVMEPIVAPVLREIRAAHSYDDLKDRLSKLYPQMDTRKLEETVSRAIFNAELAGRVGAKLGE